MHLNGSMHPKRRDERKGALLSELRSIQEQKGRIEKRLEQLRTAADRPATTAAVPLQVREMARPEAVRAPAKRVAPETVVSAPEVKRQKLHEPSNKFSEGLFSQCQVLVRGLMKLQDARPFLVPVDHVALKIPDYYSIIKHPMDMGTVLQKLKENKYRDPFEFAEDMRLIWANCRTYNQVGSAVRTMGDKLSENWEKRWKQCGVEEKWKEYLSRQDGGSSRVPQSHAPSTSHGKQDADYLRKNIREKDQQLRALVEKAPAKKPPASVDYSRDMTWEEKRKLSQQIGDLHGDKLSRVIEIIAEHNANIDTQSEDEVELDIDNLSTITLWRLKEFLDVLSNPQSQKPSKSGSDKGNTAAGQLHRDNSNAQKHSGKHEAAHAGQDSSGTSSDDTSSGSESSPSKTSGTEENVSNEVKDSTADDPNDQKPPIFHRGDMESSRNNAVQTASVFVKPTRPSGKGLELNLQNAGAWASLGTDQANGKPDSGEKGKQEGEQDALWSAFQTREQQQQKRAKERQEEEAQLKRVQDQKAKEEQEERERLRRHKEEEEARLQEAERQEVEATRKLREEQKAKELAELSNLAGTAKLCRGDGMDNLYHAMNQQDDVMSALGLQVKNDTNAYTEAYSDDDE